MDEQPGAAPMSKVELTENLSRFLSEMSTLFKSDSAAIHNAALQAKAAVINLKNCIKGQRIELVAELEFTKRLDSFLSNVNDLSDKSEAIQESVQEAAYSIKKLKNTIDRKREEKIIKLVVEGKLEQAKQKLKVYFGPLVKLDDLEEILRQCIGNDGALRNVINFVDHLQEFGRELQLAVYFSIYEEMCSTNSSSEVEILLLQDKITELGVEKETVEIKKKMAGDVNKLIENIVTEIKDIVRRKILNRVNNTAIVLNAVIPSVVDKYLADEEGDLLYLLGYAEEIVNLQSSCFFVSAIFKHFKQRNLLETAEAVHLWAYARSVLAKVNAAENPADQLYKKFVLEANDELSKNQNMYFEMMRVATDKSELGQFIFGFQSMVSVLGPFVKFYYAGDIKNSNKFNEENNNVHSYEIDGCIRKSLYEEMEKCNHLASFEAFRLFSAVHRRTSGPGYGVHSDLNCRVAQDMEFVKLKIPQCLSKLFTSSNKKCKIVNKYYSEPLCIGVQDLNIGKQVLMADYFYLRVSSVGNEDCELWNIAVDKKTSLVTFDTSANTRTVRMSWMVKAVDDENVKIFNKRVNGSVEYLTANPSFVSSSKNKRRIQLTNENPTKRQLWRLEFEN